MLCKNCGDFLKDDAQFCRRCGNPVNHPPSVAFPDQHNFQAKNIQTPPLVEERSKKNIIITLIPIVAVLLAVAIFIPTVILPLINYKDEEKNVEITHEERDASETEENGEKLTATKGDFETLSRLLLVSRLGEDFDYQTTTLRELIEGIILSPVSTVVYDTYFDKSTYESYYPSSSYDTNYNWDPLKRFNSGYGKFSEEKVKWICENIYHMNFHEDYSPVNSYCRDGYIYVGWHADQEGDLPFKPSIRLTDYTKLDDGRYEVSFEQFDEVDTRVYGWYKVTADLQEINGKRCWTFYKINMIAGNN